MSANILSKIREFGPTVLGGIIAAVATTKAVQALANCVQRIADGTLTTIYSEGVLRFARHMDMDWHASYSALANCDIDELLQTQKKISKANTTDKEAIETTFGALIVELGAFQEGKKESDSQAVDTLKGQIGNTFQANHNKLALLKQQTKKRENVNVPNAAKQTQPLAQPIVVSTESIVQEAALLLEQDYSNSIEKLHELANAMLAKGQFIAGKIRDDQAIQGNFDTLDFLMSTCQSIIDGEHENTIHIRSLLSRKEDDFHNQLKKHLRCTPAKNAMVWCASGNPLMKWIEKTSSNYPISSASAKAAVCGLVALGTLMALGWIPCPFSLPYSMQDGSLSNEAVVLKTLKNLN